MTDKIKKHRNSAFKAQSGRCFYCRWPIWRDEQERAKVIAKKSLTSKQADLFECTAEHLVAKADAGSNRRDNIAAACWLCNQRRHRRKYVLTWQEFSRLVEFRIARGLWHPFGIGAG